MIVFRTNRRLGSGLCVLLAALGLAGCADGKPDPTSRTEAAAAESLCRGKESVYLHAVKQGSDDAISICVAEGLAEKNVTIAVRWRRDGKMQEWACQASECGDVFEYERYTRPQTTYLRLNFGTGDLRYTIEDDDPGDDPDYDRDAPPTIDVTATTKDDPVDYVFDETYSLKTEKLGMMRLERYIEMHPMI